MRKKPVKIVVAVIAALVVVVAAVPFFVNVDQFRPTLEARLSSSLGRQVQIGQLSLSIFGGRLGAANISIADDPAFSRTPFVRAKSLAVGIDLLPLLLSRAVNIRTVSLTEPQVNLIRAANGRWNFSSLGNGGAQTPPSNARASAKPRSQPSGSEASTPDAASNFAVGQLKVVNGRIDISGGGKRPQTYDAVNLTARNLSYNSAFPFALQMNTPGGGRMLLDGTAGPIDRQDTSQTPFQAKVTLKQFDLSRSGVLDPAAGLAGILDFAGSATSNGSLLRSSGEIKADKLKLVRNGVPANQPVTVTYASDYSLRSQTGTLTTGDVHTGRSTLGVTGTYDLRGASPLVHMRINGNSLPVEDIQNLLPAAGVVLPPGSSLRGGTLSTHLLADGPVDRLVTSGNIMLANARLSGFSLASKLAALKAFGGVGGGGTADTVIQTLASNLHVAPDGMRADNLQLVVPGLGSLTGAGIIAPNNALNFRMLAKLSQAGAGGALTALTGLGRLGGAQNGIPFLIQGTTSNPVFIPDVHGLLAGGLAGAGQKNANPAQQGLGGILGNILNKKPQ